MRTTIKIFALFLTIMTLAIYLSVRVVSDVLHWYQTDEVTDFLFVYIVWSTFGYIVAMLQIFTKKGREISFQISERITDFILK